MGDRLLGARAALMMLFWGVVIVVVDLSVNGFDLVNDVVGWVLVAVAVTRVRAAHDDPSFRDRATAAIVLAWAALATDVLGRVAEPIDMISGVLYLTQPLVTALALLRFGELLADDTVRRTWRTTTGLLVAALAVTYTIVAIVEASASGSAFVVVAGVVFVFGAIGHFLVSVVRTRTALTPLT